jgi:hypothetical protein
MPPGWVEREARRRADDPQHQLLAIFDIFDEWFHSDDSDASVFINVLFEMGPSHPTGQAQRPLSSGVLVYCVDHLDQAFRVRRLNVLAGVVLFGCQPAILTVD